jgi:hypothetical protein
MVFHEPPTGEEGLRVAGRGPVRESSVIDPEADETEEHLRGLGYLE